MKISGKIQEQPETTHRHLPTALMRKLECGAYNLVASARRTRLLDVVPFLIEVVAVHVALKYECTHEQRNMGLSTYYVHFESSIVVHRSGVGLHETGTLLFHHRRLGEAVATALSKRSGVIKIAKT